MPCLPRRASLLHAPIPSGPHASGLSSLPACLEGYSILSSLVYILSRKCFFLQPSFLTLAIRSPSARA